MGTNKWTASAVTIEVRDQNGEAIENAQVTTSELKEETNDEGHVELYFPVTGLHVVTISAENKATKQIKVSIPQDQGHIVNVVLESK